mgnify:CR=1 FL=1
MEKKLDLQVQKTRSALTNALYDLMCQKNLDEITVTELCEKAVVRKATFYKHFGDKTELLVYMIQELQRLSEENNIIGYDPGNPSSYYTGVFRYLMDFIDSNEHFIVSILKSNASSFVRNLLEEQVRLSIDQHLRQEEREDVRQSHDMLSAIYAGSIVSCGVWWIMQKNRPEKEQVIKKFSAFIDRL